MCVLNGRITGHDNDNYTCIRTPIDSIQYIKRMHVLTVKDILNNMLLGPTCSVSVHSVLAVGLDISDLTFVYYLNSDSGTKGISIMLNMYL